MVNMDNDTTKLILGFVGIIIAIVILATSSDAISLQTSTFTVTNLSGDHIVGAINSTTAIEGAELVGGYTIYNITDDVLLGTESNFSWFTIDDGAVNGIRTVRLTVNQNASGIIGDTINASYTYGPSGYSTDSGTRSVTNLIPIMAALAILVFSLFMIFSTNAGKNLMRGFK